MLKMLDYTSLYSAGSSNLNAGIAYVDPALTYAEGSGSYDGDHGTQPQCDTDDPQPKYAQLETSKTVREEMGKKLILSKQELLTDLENVLTAIGKVHKSGNACEGEKADPYFGCSFQDLRQSLADNPGAPTYSQVELLNTLLKNSPANTKEAGGKHKAQTAPVEVLAGLESNMLDAFATKNGNDCRAAIMLAAP
jgi:hypothetical protein